jgi:hypothetical protein
MAAGNLKATYKHSEDNFSLAHSQWQFRPAQSPPASNLLI